MLVVVLRTPSIVRDGPRRRIEPSIVAPRTAGIAAAETLELGVGKRARGRVADRRREPGVVDVVAPVEL